MTDLYQRTDEVATIFRSLGQKFSQNVERLLSDGEATAPLSDVELKARAFMSVAVVLRRVDNLSETQRLLIAVFDELFSDAISSLFLAACCLDKPAQMVLRRVLELGTAIIYFWDLPHRFWGWKSLDQDVTYVEMLEHINSAAYKAYLFPTKSTAEVPDLLDSSAARSLYRILSNTVHAKISTFESSEPDRFIYSRTDWLDHLKLVSAVEDLVLDLWRARFPTLGTELLSELPQLNRLGQNV